MLSNIRRLQKYKRKKAMAWRSDNPNADRYTNLYWRYHFRIYGNHTPLWGKVVPSKPKKG